MDSARRKLSNSSLHSLYAGANQVQTRERQWKRRITMWNLDKNIKDSDMKAMLRVELQRRLYEGKETAFFLHGRPVPSKKLERFVRRKSLSNDQILACSTREFYPEPKPLTPTT